MESPTKLLNSPRVGPRQAELEDKLQQEEAAHQKEKEAHEKVQSCCSVVFASSTCMPLVYWVN